MFSFFSNFPPVLVLVLVFSLILDVAVKNANCDSLMDVRCVLKRGLFYTVKSLMWRVKRAID